MERNSFLIVPKEVLANKRLSATAKLLLAQLLDHRNKRTGQCNPKQVNLAKELGMPLRTLERGLAALRREGCIKIGHRATRCSYEFSPGEPATLAGGEPATVAGRTRHNGGCLPYKPDLIEPKSTPAASSCAAAASPVARKPVQSAGSADLNLLSESLHGLAQEAHLPPPDEDFIRRVAAAAPRATGEQIHRALVQLWKDGHLQNMRGWGFVLIKLGNYFRESAA